MTCRRARKFVRPTGRRRSGRWAISYTLVQDVAQPQHTRNDIHSTFQSALLQKYFGRNSVYENYIEARARRETVFTVHINGREVEGKLAATPQGLPNTISYVP